MNPDEMNLRHKLRLWERRFVDGSSPSIDVMIRTKDEYWRKYGWPELIRIVNEVTMEVAKERMNEPIDLPEMLATDRRVRSVLRVLRPAMARKKEKRGRYVANYR